MLRKNLMVILLISIFFTGCVEIKTEWDTSHTTSKIFREDVNKCVYEANLNTQKNMIGKENSKKRIIELRDMCLKAKGYKIISKKTIHKGLN